MESFMSKPKPCADCGDGAIYHKFTYFSILIDETIWRIFRPSDKASFITKGIQATEDAIGPGVLAFSQISVGQRKSPSLMTQTQLLAKMLWHKAKAAKYSGVGMAAFRSCLKYFIATYPSGKRIAFEGIPNPPGREGHVWWMDNKAKLKSEFTKRGLLVAKGGSAKNEREALAIYKRITPPVIVKPHSGSGSRHTLLHLTTEAEMLHGFRVAKQISPEVIIEEELEGPVYSAYCCGRDLCGGIRRDPPSVVGDGVHTVVELVEEENKREGRSGPYYSKIKLFEEDGSLSEKAKEELAWQKLTPESVPPKAARVYFHQKVNWSVGGTTCDVTDEVHTDNIELFEKTALELRAPIVGIDFIIKDISKSWKVQPRSGILECNSMPFFDNHHLPYEGKPRNVAAKFWDMVTPKEKNSTS